jgi:hypothetical protein
MTVLSPTAAADLILTLDPVAENAANVPFELVSEATGARLVEQSYPAPVPVVSWASSADSEGDRNVSYRWPNRKITLKVELGGTAVRTRLSNLEQKVAKIAREGGTLKHVFPDGAYVVFDLLTFEGYEPVFDIAYYTGNVCMVTLEFACKPFARGAPVTLTTHTEATLPVLVFTESGIAGDAPALGRLVVEDASGVDQQWVVWGMQRDTYESASSAELFFQAEGRTPQSAGAIVTISGASGGASNNAIQATVGTSFSSVMSTQALVGSHLSHFGTYRVFARVRVPAANSGAMSWALEWGADDFRRSQNATVTFPVNTWDDTFRIIDLGVITIPKVAAGAQRWEGRLVARSTVAGDVAQVDCFWMVPTERSGEARSSQAAPAITTYSARDGFDQAAGALTGKALPIGGTWTGAGDTDDFSLPGSSNITRTAVSDAATNIASGRMVLASTPFLTSTVVSVDVDLPDVGFFNSVGGVIARYVDASNFVAAIFAPASGSARWLYVHKVVAGVRTTLSFAATAAVSGRAGTVRLSVTPAGDYTAEFLLSGVVALRCSGSDTALATGGTLASGAVGIVDWHRVATAGTRYYDNFLAYSPPVDAALFASQSIEWRDDGVLRETAAGLIYQTPAAYEGDYLTIPPAGQEGKPCRFIVKASRAIAGSTADVAIDDISATLTYVPRFLVVPSG